MKSASPSITLLVTVSRPNKLSKGQKKLLRRRSMLEEMIGHYEEDGLLDRCHLRGPPHWMSGPPGLHTSYVGSVFEVLVVLWFVQPTALTGCFTGATGFEDC